MTDHAERLQANGFRMFGHLMKCPDERCVWHIVNTGVTLGTLILIAKDHLERPIVEEGDVVD